MSPEDKFEKYLKILKSYDLPVNDFAIFGSGPIVVRGLRPFGADIDVIARGEAFQKAKELGVEKEAKRGGQKISLSDGSIEVYEKWGPGEWEVDDLIDNADEIEGIRYVKLDQVKKWKQMVNRPKDERDIALINEFLVKKE